MHIVFFNPQGNFDANDSYLAAHPDFGGQLVYVKEVAQAMSVMGHKVDILTRKIEDKEWPEFSNDVEIYPGFGENLRILRFPCGGKKFLNKERLWPHLPAFIDRILEYYGDALPDFATAHYGDGGYCAVLAKQRAGIGFTFTGHSLGAQKLDKLGMSVSNFDAMEERYKFSMRIAAERLSMAAASCIITSTDQEQKEQYSHPLYADVVDAGDANKFSVIPPGVNSRIFTTKKTADDQKIKNKIDGLMTTELGRVVLVSSRLDEKKNILGVVQAYAENETLRKMAPLVICIRGIDDPFEELATLPEGEQKVFRPILSLIKEAGFKDRVYFLNLQSQQELAAAYRHFGARGSVFALTAFYEPFGLAPIEAAACGLAPVATKNGGPSEIFANGSGVLVDPFDSKDIARGLIEALENHTVLSKKAIQHVHDTYTWQRTAQGYLAVIEKALETPDNDKPESISLDGTAWLKDYLKNNT